MDGIASRDGPVWWGQGSAASMWAQAAAVAWPHAVELPAAPIVLALRPSDFVRAALARRRQRIAAALALSVVAAVGMPWLDGEWQAWAGAGLAAAMAWLWFGGDASVAAIAAGRLEALRVEWLALRRESGREREAQFLAVRARLRAIVDEHDRLTPALTEGPDRDAFLRGCGLAEAQIAGIGTGRLAALRAHGVVSAAELAPDRLELVPRLGVKARAALLAFRAECEARFMAPADVERVQDRRGRRQELEAELARGLRHLVHLADEAEASARGRRACAIALAPRLAQAFADAQALGLLRAEGQPDRRGWGDARVRQSA